MTVDDLYRFFEREVSKRTLQRDLIELSSANIPLTTREGRGRRLIWSIDAGYLKFIPMTLQSREIAAATLLKSFIQLFAGTPLERDARSFLNKARQLYPANIIAEVDDDYLQPIFGITFTGYIDYRPFAQTIDQLMEAITKRLVVKFTYKPHWKEKESIFDGNPYMMLFHKGVLYIVTHLPYYEKYVFLPLQRIRRVVLTDKRFKRERDFSLDKLREGRFGIFGFEGQKPQKVVLRFSKEIADTVAERIWHPSQKLTRHRDGSLTMELKVIISDELRSWIASWLEYVEVERPKDLRF